ncbi:MAG: hypothetical protein QGI36_06780, partial [Candidatus Thalassarchaeaceae archaeon]|nr:hypothetical protein [Candidatus Thalassarchaeaceae archaeon]
ACNYSSDATDDDGSCYNNDLGCGCDEPAAEEYYDCNGDCLNDSDGDGVCDELEVLGCTDPNAYSGYNPNATEDDGSCVAVVNGCTDTEAYNYNALANTDDNSCVPFIYGCMDATACNYNANATDDDGSCYNNDLGCGCDQPAGAAGYDCDGNCLDDDGNFPDTNVNISIPITMPLYSN